MQPNRPSTIFEKAKEFIIRLVKDEAFAQQLQSSEPEQVQQTLASQGYRFTNEELEDATLTILDLHEKGEFHELTEKELVGAVGGWRLNRWPFIQPMYGVIIDPSDRWPRPWPQPNPKPDPKPWPQPIDDPVVQPMYGVVIDPLPIQPMYGVVVSEDW